LPAQALRETRRSRQRKRIARRLASPGLLAAIVLLSHLSYLPNGFTWLDHGDVELGYAIRPLASLSSMLFEPFAHTTFYRPLVSLSLSIDHALFGEWAPGYHGTNLLLHVLSSLAVLGFLRSAFRFSEVYSLLAAALFGVHPASSLVVGAVSYRPEALALLFTLLSLFLLLRGLEKGSNRDIALASLLFLLALYSKESTLVWLPGLTALAFASRLVSKRGRAQAPKAALAFAIPASVYLLLRSLALPRLWQLQAPALEASEAIGTRLSALARLSSYLISPRVPPLSDATPIVRWSDPASLIVILLAGVAVVLLVRSRFPPLPTFLAGFTVVMLLPAANLLPLPRFTSPHYAYAPSAGLAFGLACLLEGLRGRSRRGARVATILAIAWLAVASLQTAGHGVRFRDDWALFEPAVVEDDRFREGHFYLGSYSFLRGDLEVAESHLLAALAENPGVIAYVDRLAALINLAGVYLTEGHPDLAQPLLLEAQAEAPASQLPSVEYNLALSYDSQGRPGPVVELLEPALLVEKPIPEALLLLAKAYLDLGQIPAAEAAMRKARPLLSSPSSLSIYEALQQRLRDEGSDS